MREPLQGPDRRGIDPHSVQKTVQKTVHFETRLRLAAATLRLIGRQPPLLATS